MYRLITVTTILILATSCSSIGRRSLELQPGMTRAQVIETMGNPSGRALRGTDEALQYQGIVGFGQCQYVVAWLDHAGLIGITSRRGFSVAGCGLGSWRINWDEMPTASSNGDTTK